MPVLSLQDLRCHETEDRRWDDTRIDITIDDEPTVSVRRNMRRRDNWPLERDLHFADSVTVRLWDEDRRRDDHLGTVEIGRGIGPGRARFNLDGAHYEMAYEVSDDERSSLDVALDSFRTSRTAGRWRHVPRATYLDQIAERVRRPEAIRQRDAPLCGPVVATYELARTNPTRYVHLARELFETGYLPLIGNTIEVPQGLLDDSIGGNMAHADWMFAATLRNDANALLRVRSNLLGGVRSYTLSGAMMGWSRQLLGMTNVEDISTETGGEIEAMRRASDVVSNNGYAFLQVEGAHLLRGGSDRHHYDHWAPLTTPVMIERGRIAFGTYAWGQRECVDMDIDAFCETFHGVVIASR